MIKSVTKIWSYATSFGNATVA